jgi:hypothetical protein
MGEPRQPSPSNRLATRALAAAVVASVVEDEAMPLPISDGALVVRDDVETLVFELAQEVVTRDAEANALERELAFLRSATTRIVELTPENCDHNREIDPVTGQCGDCGEYQP